LLFALEPVGDRSEDFGLMSGWGSATAKDKAMAETGLDWETVIVAEAANLDEEPKVNCLFSKAL
jgi:hypothetical protein